MSNIIDRIIIWDMLDKHIPLIKGIMDNIVSPDARKKKDTERQILKTLILLQVFGPSYRSSGIFLRNHEEYMEMIGILEVPSFQTLSRRARTLDLYAINRRPPFSIQ